MGYPCVVLKAVCKTDIDVILIEEGLTEDGGPIIAATLNNLKCNYQDVAKTVLTADKKLVQLGGIALFRGDICPELPTISGGTATIYGVERTIFKGAKVRNPDGTVNHCRLGLV